jgi:NADH-quinone oxidoreductase subunit H
MSTLASAFGTLLVLLLATYGVQVLERLLATGGSRVAFAAPLAHARSRLRQESRTPSGGDRWLFASAPVVGFVSVALAALALPLSPALTAFDPSIGVFYFIIVLGPVVVALMNAGWGANAKTGLFGTFRAATHLVSYEVPLGFAAIGPAMAAESLSFTRIVDGQTGVWYVVWQPLGFAIYLIAALMTTYRRPFDLPQAGSELGGGVLAEYSGPRLLLLELSLDALFIVVVGAGVVLFLGGGRGPWLAAPVWFALKTFGVASVLLWIGRRLPRLRHDQMLALSWKVLLPASLVNVAIVGIAILIIG